ncbi:MAG: NAD(P)/FAD-dependent oxidoreductase [Sandaracinaceae bacterium]|nr:NAD(P)/FAD-dependent oxidoreductase [Sandaracinaceae bacterium]
MSADLHDVIVIGGGPAGATVAALLAKSGADVLLLERECFPRFHIGESLLPCDLPIFERLGLKPLEAGFLYKAGAEFMDEAIGGRAVYEFAFALPGTPDHAYQVERALFDAWLLERSRALGAKVHQGERVVEVEIPEESGKDRVVVRALRDGKGANGKPLSNEYHARYLIDATGQDALLGRLMRTTVVIDEFGLGAAFTHWVDLSPEVDEELCVTAKGVIKVLCVDDGWCWAIPLGKRKISIGLVSRKRGIDGSWLMRTIEASPFLRRVTHGAKMVRAPRLLVSWSFYNRRQNGKRWLCIGDAACFIDPVFSTGVSLGMVSAAHAADVLVDALKHGKEGDPDLMNGHVEYMHHAYNTYATLVYNWYHTSLLHSMFFYNTPPENLKRGLTSLLAGDVWRNDNEFQKILMESKKRRFVFEQGRA